MKHILLVGFLLFTGAALPAAAAANPLTVTDSDFSAGYLTLAWPNMAGESFLLEREESGQWARQYAGTDRASTLTGLPDGRYRFRVSSDAGARSEPVEITVSHHSLARAFTFFGVGAVVFLILLSLLLKGPGRREAG